MVHLQDYFSRKMLGILVLIASHVSLSLCSIMRPAEDVQKPVSYTMNPMTPHAVIRNALPVVDHTGTVYYVPKDTVISGSLVDPEPASPSMLIAATYFLNENKTWINATIYNFNNFNDSDTNVSDPATLPAQEPTMLTTTVTTVISLERTEQPTHMHVDISRAYAPIFANAYQITFPCITGMEPIVINDVEEEAEEYRASLALTNDGIFRNVTKPKSKRSGDSTPQERTLEETIHANECLLLLITLSFLFGIFFGFKIRYTRWDFLVRPTRYARIPARVLLLFFGFRLCVGLLDVVRDIGKIIRESDGGIAAWQPSPSATAAIFETYDYRTFYLGLIEDYGYFIGFVRSRLAV
ncbi:hypothetical protein H072_3869 [Dactylellina haptotyla CBS 200.50]|uniref:Uncharacterized protein n=1 Tax=Dactylellina haptotyla (strain CBS 200.50) TaxID=1284197 RepID=S8AGM9_DACHA|nr:hypothetical protein H072_3869 [Dactylellina haptotyla CBS 200.50]